MRVSLEILDELASLLTAPGEDPARAALVAWGIEAYGQRRVSGFQLRTLLGIESRYEFDGFLKEHKVETYTVEEWEKDWANIQEHRKKHPFSNRHDRRGGCRTHSIFAANRSYRCACAALSTGRCAARSRP